jgi:hypothetical protein
MEKTSKLPETGKIMGDTWWWCEVTVDSGYWEHQHVVGEQSRLVKGRLFFDEKQCHSGRKRKVWNLYVVYIISVIF